MHALAPVLRPTLGRPITPGGGGGGPLRPPFDRVRLALFGAGEQGIYMPSVHESFLRGDLYQDDAGTTLVTAAGQSVGLWLDRSGNDNHASQSTDPYARPAYTASPGQLDFDGVDDKLTVAFPSSLGSDCTVGLSVPGSGASILTGQTVGDSYDIADDLCGIVIVDRALSQHETSLLTQLLDRAAGL